MKILPIILLLLLSVGCLRLVAQTNNSPYSALGIGDIQDNFFNRTSGMASTGIAYRNSRFLINNNPASFSAQDNQFFGGEIGGRALLINYHGSSVNPGQNTSFDITFTKVIFGIKPTKHWGTAIGLTPYSSQNYEYNSLQPILGTNGETSNAYTQGWGGLNKAYWSNSYEFARHFSVGIETAYLFGSVQQKVILYNLAGAEQISTLDNTFLSNFLITYGFQYYNKIGKHWDYCIGGTFANTTFLSAQNTVTVLAPDSVQLPGPLPQDYLIRLPISYGIGVSLTKDQKYSFLADYKFQNWSALNYSSLNYSYQDSRKLSLGFQISKRKTAYNISYESMYFQAGFYYINSYLNVYGQQINDIGGTMGIGFNSTRTLLSYSLAFQYGIKGTEANQLIQEKYAGLTFTISYRDFWYTKGKRFN
jgi:hypothetical protein